ALFPDVEWARAVEIALAATVLGLCYAVFWRTGARLLGTVAVFMASGGLGWSFFGAMYLFTEGCAGALLTNAVAAHALGLRGLGVAAGLMALFFRELALPYCAVALGLALWHGRKREVAAWVAGLALYTAFFAWHAAQVLPRLPPAVEEASVAKWVQFACLKFILTTTRTHLLLLLAPAW